MTEKSLKLATLTKDEKIFFQADIRLCGFEKKGWPFSGYRITELGGISAIAYLTDHRLIIEPDNLCIGEKYFCHILSNIADSISHTAGYKTEKLIDISSKTYSDLNRNKKYISLPHDLISKYSLYGCYVQVFPKGKFELQETLCFPAWDIDTSEPISDKFIDIGNRFINNP